MFGMVSRPQVLQLHLRSGYRILGDLPVFARPYRLLPIARAYFHRAVAGRVLGLAMSLADPLLRIPLIRARAGIRITEATRFDPEVNALAEEILSGFAVSAVRNVDILNWRFQQVADRHYRILLARQDANLLGYMVLRKLPMGQVNTLAVVDILYDPSRQEIGKAFLAELHRQALHERVDLVPITLNPSSPYLQLFRRAGFLPTGLNLSFVTNEGHENPVGLGEKDFAGWHLTWFDHDYV